MKVRITFSVEFELNPDYYDDGATPEEMLAVEIANASYEPHWHEYLAMGDSVVVSGELID